MEYVYEIIIDGVRRYVGRTNNIKRREGEHRRGVKGGHKKELYDKIREIGWEEEIELKVTKKFSRKIDAKRWECLLILNDYFDETRSLWQKPPRIGD